MNEVELYSYYYNLNPYKRTLDKEEYTRRSSNNGVYYLLPEWVTNSPDKWVSSCTIWKSLEYYGMTTQNYYDIVVLGLKSPDDRPKCHRPECGNFVEFINISSGYRKFCSISCNSKYLISTNEDFVKSFVYSSLGKKESPEAKKNRVEGITRAHKENPDNWKGWHQPESARKSMSEKRSGKPKSKSHKANLKKSAIKRYRRMPDLMPTYGNSKKGHYTPEKSNGEDIYYLSSWELKFMEYCDSKEYIVSVNSCRDLLVPYIKPTDNEEHTYRPDFHLVLEDGRDIVVEVKPKGLVYDDIVVAKREAAIKLFSDANIIYITLTEDEVLDEKFNLLEFLEDPKEY